MRVWDCVLVESERDLDLLEARFTEYEGLPVVHVIGETRVDYQGNPKLAWFWDNRDRFGEWLGRWNHVLAEPWELGGSDPKARKDAMRDYLAHAVVADPDDVVMHGGVDEIPSKDTVQALIDGKVFFPIGMEMQWCVYRPGVMHPLLWRGTVAHTWKYVGSFAGLREKKNDKIPVVVNAGTRMSMLGEPIQDIHPDGHHLTVKDVDDSFPRWFRD